MGYELVMDDESDGSAVAPIVGLSEEETLRLFKELHDSEMNEFSKVRNKPSHRADLAGLILLDRFVPSEHGYFILTERCGSEIHLEVSIGQLAPKVTEEGIRDLLRCGIYYSEDCDCLTISV